MLIVKPKPGHSHQDNCNMKVQHVDSHCGTTQLVILTKETAHISLFINTKTECNPADEICGAKLR